MSATSRMIVGAGLGMLAGAARGYIDSALEEQKARVQAMRDEQLSRLRMQEHTAQRESDVSIANREREAAQGRMAAFNTGTQDAWQSGAEVDAQGSVIGEATGMLAESAREKAARRHQEALKLGDKEIVAQTYTELKDVKADEEGTRRERRLDILEDFQQKQADRQQMLAEATLAHQKRMEAASATRDAAAITKAEAAEKGAQRAATATALKGVNDDIKALEKEAADLSVDPGKKKVIERQLVGMRSEAAGYRARLAAAGLPEGEKSAPEPVAPPPAAIEALRKEPGRAAEFEAKYPGAKASAFLPAAKAAPSAAAPTQGMLASADPLQKATPAQLWAAVSGEDELQKRFAIAELRRRGLIKDEGQPIDGGRFEPAI